MQNSTVNSKLVSVIIPAFNPDRGLLSLAIQSVFNQTYDCVEIIICDDGSVIPIEDYLNEMVSVLNNPHKTSVTVVRNRINLGISSARNKAISFSKGRWLTWLDSDDTLHFECISNLVKKSFSYDLIIGECIVDEAGIISRRKPIVYFELAKKHFRTENDPFLLNIVSLQPQLFLKSEFDDVGGFNESYRYSELTELFLRYISKNGLEKVNFIETAIYNYNRNRENSLTKNRKNLFSKRLETLTFYLNKIGIKEKKIKYKCRNLVSGMQEYFLVDLKEEKKLYE